MSQRLFFASDSEEKILEDENLLDAQDTDDNGRPIPRKKRGVPSNAHDHSAKSPESQSQNSEDIRLDIPLKSEPSLRPDSKKKEIFKFSSLSPFTALSFLSWKRKSLTKQDESFFFNKEIIEIPTHSHLFTGEYQDLLTSLPKELFSYIIKSLLTLHTPSSNLESIFATEQNPQLQFHLGNKQFNEPDSFNEVLFVLANLRLVNRHCEKTISDFFSENHLNLSLTFNKLSQLQETYDAKQEKYIKQIGKENQNLEAKSYSLSSNSFNPSNCFFASLCLWLFALICLTFNLLHDKKAARVFLILSGVLCGLPLPLAFLCCIANFFADCINRCTQSLTESRRRHANETLPILQTKKTKRETNYQTDKSKLLIPLHSVLKNHGLYYGNKQTRPEAKIENSSENQKTVTN